MDRWTVVRDTYCPWWRPMFSFQYLHRVTHNHLWLKLQGDPKLLVSLDTSKYLMIQELEKLSEKCHACTSVWPRLMQLASDNTSKKFRPESDLGFLTVIGNASQVPWTKTKSYYGSQPLIVKGYKHLHSSTRHAQRKFLPSWPLGPGPHASQTDLFDSERHCGILLKSERVERGQTTGTFHYS